MKSLHLINYKTKKEEKNSPLFEPSLTIKKQSRNAFPHVVIRLSFLYFLHGAKNKSH